MEVHFNADLQAKLARMATQEGRDAQTLVQEAVERLVDRDEWFLREVDKAWQRPTAANSSSTTPFVSSLTAGILADAHSLDEASR